MSEARKILVVDDERRGAELLKRALRKTGEVEIAGCGDEAWQTFQGGDFSLVVSDQRMPGMSGVELLGRIAVQDEYVGRILVTGYADLNSTVDAINTGRVHAYLSKPCSPEDLQICVRGVLERVDLARENVRLIATLSEKNLALKVALQSLQQTQSRVVASERFAAIGRMSAMIVHDLRNPLAVVSSSADLIREIADANPSSELKEPVTDILEECARLARMCNELQEFAREGDGSGQREWLAIDEVAHAALASFGIEAAKSGVELDVDLSCGASLHVDEDRVRRALLNLAYNAVEAMPGGGRLRVATCVRGEYVRISVQDTGAGMPESLRERAFEPFASEGKAGGTGLGLALVHKVASDHGGRVEVGKAEGGGTVFHLDLPISSEEAPAL